MMHLKKIFKVLKIQFLSFVLMLHILENVFICSRDKKVNTAFVSACYRERATRLLPAPVNSEFTTLYLRILSIMPVLFYSSHQVIKIPAKERDDTQLLPD